jgi:hypothetical protein
MDVTLVLHGISGEEDCTVSILLLAIEAKATDVF